MPVKHTTDNVFTEALGTRQLARFLKSASYSSYFIICDTNTLEHCLSSLILKCGALKDAEVIEIDPGEESKSLEVVASIWQTLADFGADKKTLVINLGGGVVSDVGGFAASVFKRGVDFINIPTTVLAMSDASVGGKTGINFSGVKNMVGTITQPRAVFIDTNFLQTLPFEHRVNGYAEIIKIALTANKKFYKSISSLKIQENLLDVTVISKSVALKQAIVKKDPLEKNLRKILNFGHTIGHAVESLFLTTHRPLLHGEAVAIGMAIESYICYLLKRLSKEEFQNIIDSLSLNFHFHKIELANLDTFYSFLDQDKKNTNKGYMFALLKGIGKCDPAVKVSRALVEKALNYYNINIAVAS